MDISQLVIRGQLKEAIELKEKMGGIGFKEAVNLLSRLNNLQTDNRLGILSSENGRIERNKIVKAILSDIVETEVVQAQGDRYYNQTAKKTLKEVLKEIWIENKRRNKAVSDEAKGFLKQLSDYQLTKEETPTFDPVSRRLRVLKSKIEDFVKRTHEGKTDSLEVFINKVADFIKEPIPFYNDLEEAYKLVCGRGFNDSYIKTQLENKPNDELVQIEIAERIEIFTTRLT